MPMVVQKGQDIFPHTEGIVIAGIYFSEYRFHMTEV
jgi:hypothetical protein